MPSLPAVAALWRGLPIVAGLAALYGPTYADLARTQWSADELAHGPLIALAAAWLAWRARRAILDGAAAPRPALGTLALAVGLALFVVGRGQRVPFLEVVSQIPVCAGLLLLLRGSAALRAAAFPLCFLAFLVPAPGVFIDGANALLKEQVSALAEAALYHAGFPVARQGVVIALGQYRLLMADACSGLNSLTGLAALGALFVHLAGRPSRLHNAVLLASIVPIALVANVARVVALALFTFYFGDAAGRGFLHLSAGGLFFALALAAWLALDAALAARRAPA